MREKKPVDVIVDTPSAKLSDTNGNIDKSITKNETNEAKKKKDNKSTKPVTEPSKSACETSKSKRKSKNTEIVKDGDDRIDKPSANACKSKSSEKEPDLASKSSEKVVSKSSKSSKKNSRKSLERELKDTSDVILKVSEAQATDTKIVESEIDGKTFTENSENAETGPVEDVVKVKTDSTTDLVKEIDSDKETVYDLHDEPLERTVNTNREVTIVAVVEKSESESGPVENVDSPCAAKANIAEKERSEGPAEEHKVGPSMSGKQNSKKGKQNKKKGKKQAAENTMTESMYASTLEKMTESTIIETKESSPEITDPGPIDIAKEIERELEPRQEEETLSDVKYTDDWEENSSNECPFVYKSELTSVEITSNVPEDMYSQNVSNNKSKDEMEKPSGVQTEVEPVVVSNEQFSEIKSKKKKKGGNKDRGGSPPTNDATKVSTLKIELGAKKSEVSTEKKTAVKDTVKRKGNHTDPIEVVKNTVKDKDNFEESLEIVMDNQNEIEHAQDSMACVKETVKENENSKDSFKVNSEVKEGRTVTNRKTKTEVKEVVTINSEDGVVKLKDKIMKDENKKTEIVTVEYSKPEHALEELDKTEKEETQVQETFEPIVNKSSDITEVKSKRKKKKKKNVMEESVYEDRKESDVTVPKGDTIDDTTLLEVKTEIEVTEKTDNTSDNIPEQWDENLNPNIEELLESAVQEEEENAEAMSETKEVECQEHNTIEDEGRSFENTEPITLKTTKSEVTVLQSLQSMTLESDKPQEKKKDKPLPQASQTDWKEAKDFPSLVREEEVFVVKKKKNKRKKKTSESKEELVSAVENVKEHAASKYNIDESFKPIDEPKAKDEENISPEILEPVQTESNESVASGMNEPEAAEGKNKVDPDMSDSLDKDENFVEARDDGKSFDSEGDSRYETADDDPCAWEKAGACGSSSVSKSNSESSDLEKIGKHPVQRTDSLEQIDDLNEVDSELSKLTLVSKSRTEESVMEVMDNSENADTEKQADTAEETVVIKGATDFTESSSGSNRSSVEKDVATGQPSDTKKTESKTKKKKKKNRK